MITEPRKELVTLLEDKLDELGPPLVHAKLEWPFSKSYDDLTPQLWEIIRSRHLTALHTLHALKSEVSVLQGVIQESL